MIKYYYIFLFITIITAQNEVCFDIEPSTNTNPGFTYFTKYINVLDCFEVYAEENISDDKVLHAAAIAAELLDNNEDGIVDDQLLKEELANRKALIPILRNEWSDAADDFFDNYNGDGASAVLFNFEIDPNNTGHWGDDATVEEVIHVINDIGHVSIYPDWFNLNPNSSYMSDAMDIARGGQFINHPDEYPEEAWYHYDDWTCDYQCMAIEYLYWCIVTDMGILDDIQTCNGIANEWELCTPELFEETDILMHALVNDSDLKLPQNAPDGNYCPENYILGDVNTDQVINVLDIILTVNIILGHSEFNQNADLNNDHAINIQDIILILNIILNNRN
tara:strand:+ start:75 stop:1079 length:1005 start_codon:yes stop_codon:yes gene_type:complete